MRKTEFTITREEAGALIAWLPKLTEERSYGPLDDTANHDDHHTHYPIPTCSLCFPEAGLMPEQQRLVLQGLLSLLADEFMSDVEFGKVRGTEIY